LNPQSQQLFIRTNKVTDVQNSYECREVVMSL
jgi:hypothetical protein